ncbi:MAG: AIR synthase-related protein [Acidimicrobiia bacterium]
MIQKFSVRPADPDRDVPLQRLRAALALPDLVVWRDYYLELDRTPTEFERDELLRSLGDPVTDTVVADRSLPEGNAVQVTYLRGVQDNEHDSLVTLCELLGVPASAGKVATTYESEHDDLAAIVQERFVNPNIEELHTVEPEYDTFELAGAELATVHFDLRGLSDDELLTVVRANGRNLDLRQAQHIRHIQESLGLPGVSDMLLEALDARWSDHCAHTTWKSLGNLLRVLRNASADCNHPKVLSMFSDNAGVWQLTDDWAVAVKAETHNGPSAVSAYFGQLTKIGGVLRDILGTGLGADPIGVFEYTATGVPGTPAPLAGRPNPAHIARDTIRAVKEYGNTFGVPMMSSRMVFHPAYRAKPFALGGSLGLIPVAAAQQGHAQPGDLVVLVGALTGNEGIHGASASSAGATMDEAAVQIGSPLEEVKFRAAIVDLRDAGCIRAITDLGAAGLNSAVGEMGDPGGVWLDTALVPLKTAALPPWRILLSESQERMVMAIPRDRIADARRILEQHQVRTTVVGAFTDTGRYCVVHRPELTEADIERLSIDELHVDPTTGFDVPYELLEYDPEARDVAPVAPATTNAPAEWPALTIDDALVTEVLGNARVASQLLADSQYDASVQGNTRIGPRYGIGDRVNTSYWAGTPAPESDAAVVFATAFDPWAADLDPVRAMRRDFFALLTTFVLAGVARRNVCLCDNFYTPHQLPDADAWLVTMVHELAALVRAAGTPVISGKDSSAGSVATDEGVVHVPPGVFLSGVGTVADWHVLRTNAWTTPGELLVRIGPRTPSVAATVAAEIAGVRGGTIDDLDTVNTLAFLDALEHTDRTLVTSGVPVGSGGILATVALASIAGGLGAELLVRDPAELLAEDRVAAVVTVPESALAQLAPALDATVIGRVSAAGSGVTLDGRNLLTDAALDAWSNSFAERIAQ